MAYVEFKEEKHNLDKVIEKHKSKPTFVDFYADWCNPCKILKPQIEKICKDNGFNFIVINVEENENISEEYNIQEIPYVALYLKGKKAFDFSGANQDKLNEAVEMAKKGQ